MPNDPKWRSIARASGRPISEVIAVFVHMMVCASASAERGQLQGWSDEDVAAALDMEPVNVKAICEAMQGRVLEGSLLKNWERRQRNREDDSTERTRRWRDKKRSVTQRDVSVTQGDAPVTTREEEIRKEETREEKSKASPSSPKNGSVSAYGSRF